MKFEKITLSLAILTLITAGVNEAVAATTAKSTTKKASVAKAAPKKKAAISTTKKSSSKKLLAKKPGVKAQKTITPAPTPAPIEFKPQATIATQINTTSPARAMEYSGGIGFTLGHDSNVHPDKINRKATFYKLDPTLGFKSGGFNASAAASMKNYSSQQESSLYEENSANLSLGYTYKFSPSISSTSTVSGQFFDGNSPDYIEQVEGTIADEGMPVNYSEAKFDQKVGMKSGAMNTTVGGFIAQRNYTTLWTDFADPVLERKIYEKDYTQYGGYANVTFATASWLDITLKPAVTEIEFSERDGRQPHGHAGGDVNPFNAPKYNVVTSQLGLDLAFKVGKTTITPNASIGQASDEALGAEDQSFYTIGLQSSILLSESLQLSLTPNVNHRQARYDNWRNGIPDGETRRDVETSGGIGIDLKIAKNLGLGADYAVIREWSNKSADPTENYRQEIVSSSLTYSF